MTFVTIHCSINYRIFRTISRDFFPKILRLRLI